MRFLFLAFVSVMALGLNSCGPDASKQVPLTLTTSDAGLTSQSGLSVRVIYTYDGLGARRRIVPAASLPRNNGQNPPGYFWDTATNAGISFLSNGQIRIRGVPIGKRNFQMAVELLKQIDGQFYVVGSTCYVGPDRPLTTAQLQVDFAAGGVTNQFQRARWCGNCGNAQINIADDAAAKNTPCPDSVTTNNPSPVVDLEAVPNSELSIDMSVD